MTYTGSTLKARAVEEMCREYGLSLEELLNKPFSWWMEIEMARKNR